MKAIVRLPSYAKAQSRYEVSSISRLTRRRSNVIVGDFDLDEIADIEREGGEVYPDVQFQLASTDYPFLPERDAARFWERDYGEFSPASGFSLDDVLNHIKAPEAWHFSRGSGVTIAIVDTGIATDRPEIPSFKRSSIDVPSEFAGQHWSDSFGHGSMCACIAAGTSSDGGLYNGVAPDANVLAVKSILSSTDLYVIYDDLIERFSDKSEGRLIINNSFALLRCASTGEFTLDHPLVDLIKSGVSAGIPFVFAAGNSHYDGACDNRAGECYPNTIWSINSLDEVFCVGAVDGENSNQSESSAHANSSRGPGELSMLGDKPDLVAPTYGRVPWGNIGYKTLEWWGTSGAAPQAAGAMALVLAAYPNMSVEELYRLLRESALPLASSKHCTGAGLLNCERIVQKLLGHIS
ncbi:S8 family serine peptidase [Paracoccus sp. 08]|uniref:S8 family peptidase n=1 Tax=Paracoccus sp. 08 TaxID=2606624 RepID=UPI0020952353|nr:S8 family serine peptidase [Paracoccus sp. 08]MCO6363878.1 S8 family serine peptidase [Paracoccus sp. 08]